LKFGNRKKLGNNLSNQIYGVTAEIIDIF